MDGWHETSTFSGARALRRSQTMITGDASSSDDVTRRVAYPLTVGTRRDRRSRVETHVVRMPRNVAHSSPSTHCHGGSSESLHASHGACTTSVGQCGDLTLPPQIPDDGVSSAGGCGERVLNMMVPCESGDLIELRAARAGRVGFAWVLQIPHIDLETRQRYLSLEISTAVPRH